MGFSAAQKTNDFLVVHSGIVKQSRKIFENNLLAI
jgi:hypothetical protein